MARCEDFPCCGHEVGCCPDYDAAGNQLNMVCTCGARLPVTSRYSICNGCLNSDSDQHEDAAQYEAEYECEREYDY